VSTAPLHDRSPLYEASPEMIAAVVDGDPVASTVPASNEQSPETVAVATVTAPLHSRNTLAEAEPDAVAG